MNRLILRFALGILAAFVVASVAVMLILHLSILRKMESESNALSGYVFTGVRDRIAAASGGERDRILAELATELDAPATILPADSPRLSDHNRKLISRGRAGLTVEGVHSGATLFHPVGDGTVLAVGPLKPVFGPDLWDYLLMLVVVVAIVGVAATLLSLRFVRQLKRLEAAAVQIGQGDLSARADVTTTDAVGSLARRFNEMAERNQRLLEAQRATLQAVSHELRTPTARIRFGLEMLAEAKNAAQAEARLHSIDEDLNEVDHLVTELLELNRSEAPSGQVREPIPVRSALEAMADKVRELAPALMIRVDAPQDLVVPAAAHLFRRAIRNLLTNAVRYARTRVTLTAWQAGGQVEITVDDDGPGIPAEQRARVLEPFARLDDSRSRDTGGVGLGLAIVARVLASHGGFLEIGDAPGAGARFRTVWPADEDDARAGE